MPRPRASQLARPRRGRAPADARSAERLEQILIAAIRVFSAKSYRRAQMADVAREMGMSPGTLYNYVESKEALFHLLVEHGFNPAPALGASDLPVRTPSPDATLRLLKGRLLEGFSLPELDGALAHKRPADARIEFEGIVRELYRAVSKHREGIVIIERSAHDWPELAALFYASMRRDLMARMKRYLVQRMDAGQLRRVPNSAAAARLIIETVAWFAMHRAHDPDSRELSDAAAEATVIDVLSHGFTKE
ncbi:MAG TPA: helix-turn-helix domain-containing protein [Myxococcota bacterium]|nr:helix-turn-helix domain-containing protein [Myxococcota bacterium]